MYTGVIAVTSQNLTWTSRGRRLSIARHFLKPTIWRTRGGYTSLTAFVVTCIVFAGVSVLLHLPHAASSERSCLCALY